MASTPPRPGQPQPRGHLRRRLMLFGAAAAAIALVAVLVVRARSPSGGGSATAGTGEVAGVTVDQPSVDLGHVPLNLTVNQTFHLRNTGRVTVGLGEASIAVLQGC